MITAIGRFITVLAGSVASALGFEVIYGDTDSVFLTKVSRHHITADNYLNTLHCVSGVGQGSRLQVYKRQQRKRRGHG
ncbi:hypothetical protein JB92DRAFT_2881385 [Gautieria morchelliformis]|nr:hypothetical protein JB92DRAFT_2881385 [Gautieria morchelliformis]